eukprot:jgi/Botrbrau1/23339/Bobra.0667s0001.1
MHTISLIDLMVLGHLPPPPLLVRNGFQAALDLDCHPRLNNRKQPSYLQQSEVGHLNVKFNSIQIQFQIWAVCRAIDRLSCLHREGRESPCPVSQM